MLNYQRVIKAGWIIPEVALIGEKHGNLMERNGAVAMATQDSCSSEAVDHPNQHRLTSAGTILKACEWAIRWIGWAIFLGIFSSATAFPRRADFFSHFRDESAKYKIWVRFRIPSVQHVLPIWVAFPHFPTTSMGKCGELYHPEDGLDGQADLQYLKRTQQKRQTVV